MASQAEGSDEIALTNQIADEDEIGDEEGREGQGQVAASSEEEIAENEEEEGGGEVARDTTEAQEEMGGSGEEEGYEDIPPSSSDILRSLNSGLDELSRSLQTGFLSSFPQRGEKQTGQGGVETAKERDTIYDIAEAKKLIADLVDAHQTRPTSAPVMEEEKQPPPPRRTAARDETLLQPVQVSELNGFLDDFQRQVNSLYRSSALLPPSSQPRPAQPARSSSDKSRAPVEASQPQARRHAWYRRKEFAFEPKEFAALVSAGVSE